jgi:uncharacterized protein (TIGR02594 family)
VESEIMISRRYFIRALATLAAYPALGSCAPENRDVQPVLSQLLFPDLATINEHRSRGESQPTDAQVQRAKQIIAATPVGPTPLDVAQSFIDRFGNSEPDIISQWPTPDAWNPLIVEFFSATNLRVSNDMIAWCAAFANWCLLRAGRSGSGDASSQSFLGDDFAKTDTPKVGDLVVFTSVDNRTNQSLGIGHVGFVKGPPDSGHVDVLGGNQSSDGHSSIISSKLFSTQPFAARRHVNGSWVLCTMKICAYLRIV